jgi:diguanylate cyclase (GGDEF)-like protein
MVAGGKDMDSWIEISDRLRERYVLGSAYALDRLAGLIERLAAQPRERQMRDRLVELRRIFQGLAGSGGSHGFPRLSAGGAEGERSCSAVLDGGKPPAKADLERWRALVRELAAELAAPPSPAPGRETALAAARPPALGAQGTGEPARILYMEDSAVQAAYTRKVLAGAGYLVHCCADPERFEAELDAFRPDLVLMDILLPGVTGYDLVRRLRGEERLAALPVLFLTTEDQVQARIETVCSGGDDHLVKPVPPTLLLSAVAARLERGRKLTELLTRDGLTRLLTRSALLDCARLLVVCKRQDPCRKISWVMIDLDRFKSINDRFGHPVGDRVLAGAADLLSRSLRRCDYLGRCGGEEFALLLDGPGEDEALGLIERLRAEFGDQRHAASNGTTFCVTLSAGIAVLEPGMDLEQWRSAADEALYAAKAAGRNRVVVASRAFVMSGEVAPAAAGSTFQAPW